MSSTNWRNAGARRLRGCGNGTVISATILPGFAERTRMRSHMNTASSILWVTIRMALIGSLPLFHRSSKSVRRVSAVSTSSAENGSSISSRVGSTTRARAKPTRCRKSTRLNSSHSQISYAVFCLKKKKKKKKKLINKKKKKKKNKSKTDKIY